ncbi:MAG: FHA domain-containing protein [Thiotrichales bacterium]
MTTISANDGAPTGEAFFIQSRASREALTALERVTAENIHLAVLTGARGVGKTRLIEAYAARVDEDIATAVVSCPPVHSGAFQQRLLAAFGLPPAARDEERPLQALFGFLLDQRLQSSAVVLFVDDAHLLSGDATHTLRILSNLKLNGEHLLHIVLVGRPQLTRLIESDTLLAIRGEIGLEVTLDAMEPTDIVGFIEAILSADEKHHDLDITDPALSLLYRYSGGNPDALRRLFDLALAHVNGADAQQLTPEHVWDALESSAWVSFAEQSGGPRRHAVIPLSDTRVAARLVEFRGGARLASHPLRKRSVVVGRAPSCEISADDASVSRTHARISLSNEAATLRDLASQNGSYINGTRIDEQPILDGDVLRFGHVTALFYYRYVSDEQFGFDTQYTVEDMAEDRRLESEVESLFVAQETAETRARVVPLRELPAAAPVPVATLAAAPEAVEGDIGSVSAVDPIPDLALGDGVLFVSDPAPPADEDASSVKPEESDDLVEPVLDAPEQVSDGADLLELESDTDWFTESRIDLDSDGVIEIEIPDELIDADEVIAQAAETGSERDAMPPELLDPLADDSHFLTSEPFGTFAEVPEAILDDFAETPEDFPAPAAAAVPVAMAPAAVHSQKDPTGIFAFRESDIIHSIDKPFFTIGRDADNDIQIDSTAVSRAHALIVFADGELTIEDLDSANGTFLNSEPVSKGRLKNGDFLRIGDKLFRFQPARADQNATELGNLREIGFQQADGGIDRVFHSDADVTRPVSRAPQPPELTPDAEHVSAHAETTLKPLQTIPLADDTPSPPVASATRTAAIWISAGIVLTGLYLVAKHQGTFETPNDRREAPPAVAVAPPEQAARPIAVPVPPPIQPPYGEAVSTAGAIPIIRDAAELSVDAPPADPIPTVTAIVSDPPVAEAPAIEATKGIALLPSRPSELGAIVPTSDPATTDTTATDQGAEVMTLLAQAQRQTDALKLTEPARDNAFLTYQRVLRLDPGNREAELGLGRIAEAYLGMAQQQKSRRNYTRSLAMIDKGLAVQRGHRELRNLRNEVRALAAAEASRKAPKPVDQEIIVAESEIEIEQPAFRETREPLIEAPSPSQRVTSTPRAPVSAPNTTSAPVTVAPRPQPAPPSTPSTTSAPVTIVPRPQPALPSQPNTASAPVTVAPRPQPSTPNTAPMTATPVAPPAAPRAQPAPTAPPAVAAPKQQAAQPTQPQQIAKATEPAVKSEPKEQLQRQVNQMQIQRLVSQAKQRFEAGDYPASRDLIEQGLGIEARNLELLALRDQVIQRQARTEQRDADKAVSTIVQALTAQARKLREEGKLGESLRVIESGLAIEPGNNALRQLKATVEKDIKG